MRVVIESPLAGEFVENYRYLLWCCRAVWLRYGLHAIGSHMLSPWFMDDTKAEERAAGIDNPWAWSKDVPHWFFVDRGISRGMVFAFDRCSREGIGLEQRLLSETHTACWEAFSRGEWPPHTPGFVIAPVKWDVAPDQVLDVLRKATQDAEAQRDGGSTGVAADAALSVRLGPPSTAAVVPSNTCKHLNVRVPFDPEASKGLSATEIKNRWPRFHGRCPDCDFYGVIYASKEHYIAGDW